MMGTDLAASLFQRGQVWAAGVGISKMTNFLGAQLEREVLSAQVASAELVALIRMPQSRNRRGRFRSVSW
jgi:hypothetical protein